MRVLERRLRRGEVGPLPPVETARLHEIVLDLRRRRAARLGLRKPEDDISLRKAFSSSKKSSPSTPTQASRLWRRFGRRERCAPKA